MQQIQQEFTRVVLQAGYQGNYGVIFAGNIKQTISGRESATDTFLEIIAGDGDRAYNFAVVSTTIAPGATSQQQVQACITAMQALGTSGGGNASVPVTTKLPSGKVLHGQAKTYLRNVAQTTKSYWSIQNEQVTFIPQGGVLPGTAISINSGNGMIGSPQQTLEGVNVKCLLNPSISMGTRIQLNNASIQRLAINLNAPGTAAAIPAPLTSDGVYFTWVCDHKGDTRGVDWYSNLSLLYIDPTYGGNSPVEVGL